MYKKKHPLSLGLENKSKTLIPSEIDLWTVYDVSVWLKIIGFPQYITIFLYHVIDGFVLTHCSPITTKEMIYIGIEKYDDIQRLTMYMNFLRDQYNFSKTK